MKLLRYLPFGLLPLAAGCAGSEALDNGQIDTPGGSVNVVQGGAQDIALFRSIVEQGQVPTPDTLDPVGFFAEHAIDLPDADCGKEICIHPYLAVAPRFNGGNWTMAFVAMNTPVDPSELDRPPVHMTIAVESSTFTNITPSMFQAGVEGLIASLRPEDRVSFVVYGDHAQRKLLLGEPGSEEVSNAITAVVEDLTFTSTNAALFDGIAAAATTFEDGYAEGFVGDTRLLLVTSGHATIGITNTDHILEMGEAIVEQGSAFGVIGVGTQFDAKIPSALGSMGAGTYAYAADSNDLSGLLTEEGQTTLYPLATEFNLTIKPSAGYKIGRIYGTKRAGYGPEGAVLSMPALFIGQRDGASDVGGSRRGGGGGLFVELLFDESSSGGVGADAPAFQVSADWKSAEDGAPQLTDLTMINSLPPGQNPDEMWWNLSDGGSGKQYMMLNMYLALRGAVDFYQTGDCARALGVIDMMQTPVGAWLGQYSDTDIQDDNLLMLQLRQNIQNACSASQSTTVPIEPTNFSGGCCYS
ncbi:MAG: hypothetical protein IPK82_17490 [Polyangiaceae bacterium]|nr:hypothetical protein [Polyangiaceae bacterium]